MRDIRRKRALAHAHYSWNGIAFSQTQGLPCNLIKSYFKQGQIVHEDNEIIVTDVGFVVMAIYSDRAIKIKNALIVPGIDSEGLRGHLVLCDKKLPYHSFASQPEKAYLDALQAQKKASALLSNFGSRSALQQAIAKTPWYRMSTGEDFNCTGLCQWGANAFLKRHGLQRIAWRFGLPKCLLQIAGIYGERIIAAGLVRRQRSGQH